MQNLPRLTVWAWERREDLRTLDPATTAVAWLDRTIILDARGVRVEGRRQPLLLPASATLVRIPVVRMETRDSADLSEASAEAAAQAILGSFDSRAAALQIDFDARRSERAWYRDVLTRVRRSLPQNVPLSITALASWCSYDNAWIHTLPIDEAVPMFFRMEPDRQRASLHGGTQQPRADDSGAPSALTPQESLLANAGPRSWPANASTFSPTEVGNKMIWRRP